jgi:lipoate-protein ligase A
MINSRLHGQSASALRARLILDPKRDGFWNMAADEALFNNIADGDFAAGTSAVTLRIYGWSRPTLSLGRRQKFSDTNLEACRTRSIDVVKRIGGGGAVLHGTDISYCFVSRRSLPGMPDVTDPLLWRELFIFFLESVGITGDGPCPEPGSRPSAAACFSAANGDEPTIDGRKWVGSARRKSRVCFMQHGSILLEPQPNFLGELVPGSRPDISAGLTEFVPLLTGQSATDAFVGAVEKKMHLDFSTSDYTDVENSSINKASSLKTMKLSTAFSGKVPVLAEAAPRVRQ